MDSDTFEMQPRMDFYGLTIGSGAAVPVSVQTEEDCSVILHITQVALGPNAKAGPHTVLAVRDAQQFAIGTLEKGRCEQFRVEFSCTSDLLFRQSGQSDVHLTGYRMISPILDQYDSPDRLPGEGESSEEYSSDEEDDLEADEAPALVRQQKLQAKKVPALAGQQNGRKAKPPAGLTENIFDAANDDDSDEGLDDDDLLAGSDDEDSEDEDAEDDERRAANATADLLKSMPAAGKRAAVSGAREAAPKKAKVISTVGATPAAAPATAGAAGEYSKSIKEYLLAHGPTALSNIGSKVSKPAGLNTKLKKFLDDSGMFLIDAKQNVSLK